MIMCCRQKQLPYVSVRIRDDKQFKNRKLEVLICVQCGALIADLTQYNIEKGVWEVIRPKRKNTASFIKKMQKLEWHEIKEKTGTKSNMNYIYGENREHKNGKIYQYSVDFNGVKKLVKIVNQQDTIQIQ